MQDLLGEANHYVPRSAHYRLKIERVNNTLSWWTFRGVPALYSSQTAWATNRPEVGLISSVPHSLIYNDAFDHGVKYHCAEGTSPT